MNGNGTAIDAPKAQRPVRLRTQFEKYRCWKSLPAPWRGRQRVRRADEKGRTIRRLETEEQFREKLAALGVVDPTIVDIALCKTQADFGRKFGVKKEHTMSRWNRRLEGEGHFNDTITRFRSLTPTVLNALAIGAIRNQRAAEIKLFLQVVEGWKETTRIEQEHEFVVEFSDIDAGEAPIKVNGEHTEIDGNGET